MTDQNMADDMCARLSGEKSIGDVVRKIGGKIVHGVTRAAEKLGNSKIGRQLGGSGETPFYNPSAHTSKYNPEHSQRKKRVLSNQEINQVGEKLGLGHGFPKRKQNHKEIIPNQRNPGKVSSEAYMNPSFRTGKGTKLVSRGLPERTGTPNPPEATKSPHAHLAAHWGPGQTKTKQSNKQQKTPQKNASYSLGQKRSYS